MIPAAQSSAPARNLFDYWNEARLRVASARSASVRPAPGIVPWRAALEDILKVGYGIQAQPRFVGGAWQQVRWRTTPSAGALYPFEVIVTVVGEGSYLWDIDGDRLVPYDAPPLAGEALAGAGLATRPGHRVEALLTFVARPWLSMKKYRLRGYSYCHLDVGHTATNLGLYTAALGHDPIVHLRFSRAFLAEHLRLDGLCREPLAVLSFASTGPVGEAQVKAPAGGTLQTTQPVGFELPLPPEVASWESLQGFLSFDCALERPAAPAVAPLLAEPAADHRRTALALPASQPPLAPSLAPPLATAADWRSAILARRSAKGFRREPVTAVQISELLGALRADGLPADCSRRAMRLGVRLVARNVDGLSGVFAYSPHAHALLAIDGQPSDPRPACMQQELAGDAAALVVLHAPLGHLVERHGYSAFAELQFHAAQLGQRLHLAAARLGPLGMTCIGGFDGEECAAFARLDPGDEAIYVILIGVRDDSAFKHDRLAVAFSHGHTTTLEER